MDLQTGLAHADLEFVVLAVPKGKGINVETWLQYVLGVRPDQEDT